MTNKTHEEHINKTNEKQPNIDINIDNDLNEEPPSMNIKIDKDGDLIVIIFEAESQHYLYYVTQRFIEQNKSKEIKSIHIFNKSNENIKNIYLILYEIFIDLELNTYLYDINTIIDFKELNREQLSKQKLLLQLKQEGLIEKDSRQEKLSKITQQLLKQDLLLMTINSNETLIKNIDNKLNYGIMMNEKYNNSFLLNHSGLIKYYDHQEQIYKDFIYCNIQITEIQTNGELSTPRFIFDLLQNHDCVLQSYDTCYYNRELQSHKDVFNISYINKLNENAKITEEFKNSNNQRFFIGYKYGHICINIDNHNNIHNEILNKIEEWKSCANLNITEVDNTVEKWLKQLNIDIIDTPDYVKEYLHNSSTYKPSISINLKLKQEFDKEIKNPITIFTSLTSKIPYRKITYFIALIIIILLLIYYII